LLLCHRMSLQGQECGDLILISAKSSIYSTKPIFPFIYHLLAMLKPKRFDYLDIVRVSAILLVVFIHSIDHMAELHGFDTRHYAFFMHGVLRAIGRIGVPLFFMVSGALLLIRSITPIEFYLKRLPRLIFSILIISLLYEYICVRLLHFPANGNISLKILSGDPGYAYQLWFLYTTIGIYLAAPFIQKFLDSSSDQLILTYITISFSVGSLARSVAPFMSGMVIPSVMMDFFNPYITYFIMGYFFHNRVEAIDRPVLLLCGLLLSVFLPGAVLEFVNLPGENLIQKSDSILWHDKPTVYISAACAFLLIKAYGQNRIIHSTVMLLVQRVAAASFTIYLFHIMVIYFFKSSFLATQLGFIASSVLLMMLCLSLCLLLHQAIRYIPYARKVLS
ncbi:acyltransferase, partial [Shimwellia pseudoproteus]|uniref:acyltransferase n=1 Tax=Shimwellia pseudoproteus TaxID=570012 RepID=UPI001E5F5477